MKTFLLLLFCSVPSLAQSPAVQPVPTQSTTASSVAGVVATAVSGIVLPDRVGDFSRLPTYIAGAGVEYNQYTSPAAGIPITAAVRVKKTNVYSWTTMDMPVAPMSQTATAVGPSPASIRTGIAYVAAHTGGC